MGSLDLNLYGKSSGTQMGGWFLNKINTIEDFKGLKMRIPGLAAEVLNRMGGTAVCLHWRHNACSTIWSN